MSDKIKKIYTQPDCEVIRFSIQDIITESSDETGGDNWQLPEL